MNMYYSFLTASLLFSTALPSSLPQPRNTIRGNYNQDFNPHALPYITTQDNTQIYYKDWGNSTGQPIVFSHGWPLDSDNWENQMFFLGQLGYRTIAHDRRGHGRSSQPWNGHNMNQYADDLNELVEHLDLQNVMMVGHSTGGGEVVRFLTRHGESRVTKAVLVDSVTPHLVLSPDSPNGVPIATFDGFRQSMIANRAQFFLDVPSGPFFGFNRPNATVSQGLIQSWFSQGMLAGFKAAYDCIAAFSETDFTEDMKNLNISVLLIHGTDDQVVPIDAGARAGIKLLKNGTLKEYVGAPHGVLQIASQELNEDLLAFVKS